MKIVNILLRFKRKLGIMVDYLRFANDGISISDKYNSYLLRVAMENPFEERSEFLKKRLNDSRELVTLKHKYFNNIKLEFNLFDNFQMAICKEFFLENTYDLSLINFTPELIIDCGGYRGYFSFIATKAFKNANIICIEAHPANYLEVKKSITVNKLTKISLMNKAVSATPGKINLSFDGTNSMIKKSKKNTNTESAIETLNLYNLIGNNNLLLKVDIEGAELDFFPEIISKLPKVCGVFLETHDGWRSLLTIKNEFERNGFAFKVIRERDEFIDSFAQRCL